MLQDGRWAADTGVGTTPATDDVALRAEHARLVGENLEYMAVLSRYSRGIGLCATTSLDAVTERIVEILCLETRSQSGLLWVASDDASGELRLAAAAGAAKPAEEPESIVPSDLAPGMEALGEPGCGCFLGPPPAGASGPALYVRLRDGGRLVGVARVSEPGDAGGYGLREIAAAEQVAEVAALGLANALRFRALERRSLREPRTEAYTPVFFDGAAARELERARRFGRQFSLLEIELCGVDELRAAAGDETVRQLLDDFAGRLQQALRGTDVCAADGETRYRVLLAETDAIGAVILKWRILELVATQVRGGDPAGPPPPLRIAAATYPVDGGGLDALARCLTRRLAAESNGLARFLERECHGFAECRQRLLREAAPVPPRLSEQALRFVLEELRRRADERALVWLAPGPTLRAAAVDELSRHRGRPLRAQIIVLTDEDAPDPLGLPVTWAAADRAAVRSPFLVYVGERSAYAWIGERDAEDAPVFHTSDRAIVERLAFHLQRDLAGVAPE